MEPEPEWHMQFFRRDLMYPDEIKYMLAKQHALEIIVQALCLRLNEKEAAAMLGHVQRMTNRVANFNSNNPITETVFKQIAEELIVFQRLLLESDRS